VIQQAYDVLSDPQERAWYDSHREQILRGGLGEKLEDEGIDLFQYFSSACYSGFGDDESGFYGVYIEVFNTLAKEDMDFIDDEDSDFEIPGFGKSADEYEMVVGPFYAYWTGYSTPRSFSWLDKYDTRQGENRWVKRKMEAENKKVRDKARKERNEVVRNLVQFIRKRDKRVAEYSKKLVEKAELNKKKTQEFQKKQRDERKKLFDAAGGETGGFSMGEMEEQLRQLEGQYTDSESEVEQEPDLNSEEEEELGEELDDLYCVACDKMFKTVGAKDNHETSRKHKDKLQKLIEEMKEEEAVSDVDDSDKSNGIEEIVKDHSSSNENEEDVSAVKIPVESEPRSKGRSKKQKKKQKKRAEIVESDSEPDNDIVTAVPESSDEDSKRGKNGKSKSKKKLKKDKSPGDPIINNDTCEPENSSKVIVDESDHVVAQESECPENIVEGNPDEEITIIKASATENEDNSNKSRSKTSKKENSLEKRDNESESLLCVQCRRSFPSKNKLFNHLKSTGHAVHIPSDSQPAPSKSKKKSKNCHGPP